MKTSSKVFFLLVMSLGVLVSCNSKADKMAESEPIITNERNVKTAEETKTTSEGKQRSRTCKIINSC
jgi:hypothetical protein